MANQNEIMKIPELELNEDFTLVELYNKIDAELEMQLDLKYAELEALQVAGEEIGNPESLGKAIRDEVWKQFVMQIGLEAIDESLLRRYERIHPETYADVAKTVMQDQRYINANKEMKRAQEAGTLLDSYTGKPLKLNTDQANLDHVIARKELFDNTARQMADIPVKDLANLPENLRPTNEALNKSKNAMSVKDYLKGQEEREKRLIEQAEAAKAKIDASSKSALDKRLEKEKIDKRLEDKLSVDPERMSAAAQEAWKAVNMKVYPKLGKEISIKAGTDALKMVVISGLSTLLKEIVNGLIRFFRATEKTFASLGTEIKKALGRFFSKLKAIFQGGATTAFTTVVAEIGELIWKPIKKAFKFIRQGIYTLVDAGKYLLSEEGKNAPGDVKMIKVLEIITSGLTAAAALVFGELIGTFLSTFPGLQIVIPYIGSIGSIIGYFISGLTCGVIGAIILNRLENTLTERQRKENEKSQFDKKNEIITLQRVVIKVKEEQLEANKNVITSTIAKRHREFAKGIKEDLKEIFEDNDIDNEYVITKHDNDFEEMRKMLKKLHGKGE